MNLVLAQGPDHFRVIGGIPHLPVVDPGTGSFSAGMLILHATTKTPLIYSGSGWVSLCSTNLPASQSEAAFNTSSGIPSLPILAADPSGPSPVGAVYYSTTRQRIMIYSGTAWLSLGDIRSSSGTLPGLPGFGTSASLQISRIPVLAADPFPIGLSDGAFYFSSGTKSIRYYANGTWQNLNCSTIETIDPSAVTNSSFTSGIRIMSDGLSFSETGICWSKSLDPVYSLPTKLAFSGSIPDIGELPLTVINNLDANTLYYIRAYAVLQNTGEVIYGENKSLTTDLATFPTIITLDWKPAKLKPISSEGGGDIIRDGGAYVNQRGVIYSELPEPKSDPNPIITIDGSGVGRFDSKMAPLKANTTYYYRAYADNVVKGRGYGDPVYSFTTPGPTPPELSPSITISNITDVSASTKVTILNNGGAEVRARGVSWSKTPIAETDWRLDHPDIDHEPSQTVSAFDIGTFDCQLLRLEPGQRYYVRTYARNDIGTSFSSETAFDATGLPTINTLPLNEQATTGKTATGSGEVISTGASPLIQRGFIWSKVEAFDPATETDTMMTVLPIGVNTSGTGLFYGLRQELEPGTTYYYCAYAKNSFGTNYGDVLAFTTAARPTVITDPTFSQITATSATGGGNVTNDGGEPVLYKGLSWNRDPLNPEPNEYVLYGNGTGPFFIAINGLRANAKYYVRAFGTNSVGPGYGDPVELNTGAPVAATVHTYHINNTSGTSVPAGGYVLNDGGSDVKERGFCWNTTGVPTVNDNKVSGGTGTGRFDLMIAGLQSEKTYYVRAYAITDAPLPSYGNEVSFKTITKPTVFTKTDVTVTGTTATVSGDIVSDGGSRVSRSGIVWDLEDEPDISLPTRVQSGTGMGEFNHSIGELLGNSTYFYRAYATNEVGTAYGYSRTLNTPPPVKPTVKTLPVKNITAISGLGGGEIISHGGALLVETGLVWSTLRDFIPEDVVNERTRQTDPGTFTSLITGLQPGVKYYVCAYAKNAAGLIAYGDPIEFTTWNYALVKTGDIISKTNVSATGQGQVLNNGGTAVTRNGLVWAEHEEPTINDFVSSPPGSGVGTFTANLTNLFGNTTYYVRAFAINSAGVAYGPEKVFFKTDPPVAPTIETRRPESTALTTALAGGTIVNHGGGRVTSRGIVWGSTSGFDYRNPDGKFEQTGYGEGVFSVEMTGLIPGRKYYVRAFADNGSFKGYGPEIEFTQADYPALTTRPASAKTNKTITTGGVILSTGHAPLLHTGMVWSTDENFDPKAEQANRVVQGDPGNFTATITGLRGGTDYYVYAFAENVAGVSYGQKEKIQTLAAGLADVITTEATDVTGTTAKTGGNILDDGGSYITTRGIAYTENKDLEPRKIPLANKVMQAGSAVGPFVTYLSGLKENTIYYIRAFAVNGVDTTYGDQKFFRTQGRPIVSIDRASSMVVTRTGTAVVIDARIVDDGRAQMLGHGIVWSTTSGPTIDLPTKIAYNRGQIGGYQAVIVGLQPATEYFVRGYGINTVGLNYGNIEFHFETPPITPPVLSVLSVGAIDATKATAVAEITENGGSWVSERGFIWSNDIDFDPVGADENHKIRLGEDIGRFEGTISNLNPGETYYIWAYAVNKADTRFSDMFVYQHPAVLPTIKTNPLVTTLSTASAQGGGTVESTGGAAILTTGLVWSTKQNFDPESDPVFRTTDGDLGGSFTGLMNGLSERVTYYLRAYATNEVGTAYGEQVSFCLFATAPELTTISVQNILGRSADVFGSLDRDGGMPVTRWGFVWSTDKEPDYYKHPHTETIRGEADPVFTGNFNGVLSSLLPNTQYYVRAYAINLAGVGYGVPVPFLTADYPTLTAAMVHQIGTTTATIKGNITHNGRLPIIKRGVVWSRYDNPDVNPLGRAEEALPAGGAIPGHGEGEFLLQVTGLEPENTYYAKAYGINEVGEKYSVFVKFKTNPVTSPSIETVEPTNVTPETADPGGNVTDNGGADVSLQGILYHTDSTIVLDFDNAWKTINNGSAQFSALLSGLEPGTKYYYRAYAYNGYKYGYGEKKDFTTPAVPPRLGEVAISEFQSTSVKATAELIHGGGSPVTARGFIWTSQATDPTIISNEGFTDDLTGTITSFSHTLASLQVGKVYRVRAYARNGVDIGYGPVEVFTICPPTITRFHFEGHNGAPSTKEVTYNVVSSSASGDVKCWIAQNLGAKDFPSSATDINPDAIGWFWQFNRSQGYQRDGTGRLPNTVWPSTTQPGNWDVVNDPCKQLLGTEWRLPTKTEWDNVMTGFNNLATAFTTDLKFHAGGYLNAAGAQLAPTEAVFWSSTGGTDTGSALYLRSSASVSALTKLNALSVRCVMDEVTLTLPSVSKVKAGSITEASISGTAAVTLDGGSQIIERGYVWNTTGGNPEIDPVNKVTVALGGGTGEFNVYLTGLDKKKTYYIWGYATNTTGTTYSEVETFGLCAPEITRYHYAGHNGAPVTGSVTYKVIRSNITGEHKCWIGQNLGARDVPGSATDLNVGAYGWYWQFDGNQGYARSGSSRTPATTWNRTYVNGNWDPAKDPCKLLIGEGWRLPTKVEWETVKNNFSNLTGAYNTPLKLHATGYLNDLGTHVAQNEGLFWSSTGDTDKGYALYLRSTVTLPLLTKLDGFPVRCLLDEDRESLPSVSKVALNSVTESMTSGSAAVTLDGGSAISARGVVWNTTGGNPEVDPVTRVSVSVEEGTGEFHFSLPGLESGKTYYVWAYASNNTGTAYSAVEKFVVCPTSVIGYHAAGHNGTPSNRTIEYGVVGSNLTGVSSCWITRNLGATQQASTLNDPSDAAAGWYWQFNKSQAYEITSAIKDPAGWGGTSNTENSDWKPENDPCNLLLGGGWRLPTRAEWTSVINLYPTPAMAFQSDLKLHYSGYLDYTGVLRDRTTSSGSGYFWSSNQGASSSNAATMTLVPNVSKIMEYTKADGFNVRCVMTETLKAEPSVGGIKVIGMTPSDADVSAVITTTGGTAITDRGFVWNETGADPRIDVDPTVRPAQLSGGGQFGVKITGLNEYKVYHVWAFAKNSGSDYVLTKDHTFKLCPPVSRKHIAGVNGAPVTMTINYPVVSSVLSGEPACWIAQNLGAAKQGSTAADAAPETLGWYWQFGTSQGYEYNSTRIPAITWTTPATQNSNWLESADPCNLLLGVGWRLPTKAEYVNADAGWTNLTHGFTSELKLHGAGYLDKTNSAVIDRTRAGAFWSIDTDPTNSANGWHLGINNINAGTSMLATAAKGYGLSARCILTSPKVTSPIVSNVSVSDVTIGGLTARAEVLFDGGDSITEHGLVWNTSGDPTLESNTGIIREATNATAEFTLMVTGLQEGFWYIRAWARNGSKMGYGPVERVLICAPSINRYHIKGIGGAARDKEIEYKLSGVTIGSQSNCWIAQNLGASVQAGSENDTNSEAAGWYWQFNRGTAYESGTPPSWPRIFEKAHWASPDPCTALLGGGWRLPTATEWTAVSSKWSTTSAIYSSLLKAHAAGWYSSNGVNEQGTTTRYWSNTSGVTGNGELDYYTGMAFTGNSVGKLDRNIGAPIRCLLGSGVATLAAIHKVSVSGSSGSGFKAKVIVIHDGGSKILKRGFVWGTTNNPTLASNTGFTEEEAGVGEFAHDLSGLQEGVLYYVKAYVTNAVGTIYSSYETVIGCPSTFSRYHVAGTDGAAVTKRVDYKVTTSNLSGTSQCWITQNLGADKEAADSLDTDPAAAGWYWQFSRQQAYEYGNSRVPITGWDTYFINEPGGFTARAKDPCSVLLGQGWRMPTSAEWAAIASKWKTIGDGFKSELKMHASGWLTSSAVVERGVVAKSWSTNPAPGGSQGSYTYGAIFQGSSTQSVVSSLSKSNAATIRCLTTAVQKTVPSLTLATVVSASATEATASATITTDGHSGILERGFVWKMGGGTAPTIADNKVVEYSSEMGPYTMPISGLVVGQTYQVRSYANNEKGPAYGPVLTYTHR